MIDKFFYIVVILMACLATWKLTTIAIAEKLSKGELGVVCKKELIGNK